MIQKIKISSTGYYAPPKVQTSEELSGLIGRSEKWIISRTGIHSRHIAEEPMDVIGAKAARAAIGDGSPPDCIINASTTPLQLLPDGSVFIQRELGYSGIPSWSVHGTCLSFLIALNNAAALISTGVYKRILIVSAETGTPWRNMKEPESAALFGDGAAAAIVEASSEDESGAILDWEMTTWPEGAETTEFRGAGTRRPPFISDQTKPEDYLFHMNGPRVFKLAAKRVKEVLAVLFERNHLELADVDRLILHQASGPAIEGFIQYGFARDKVVNILPEFGNCIAASIPLALAIANEQGLLQRGDTLLIGGTGAGLSVAFALLQW